MKNVLKRVHVFALCVLTLLSACETKELEEITPETQLGPISKESSINVESDKSSVIDTDIIGNIICIGSSLTGLPGACISMTLINSINAPSGNETSIFEGVVPADIVPSEPYTYSTTYDQDGKTYSAFTELTTNGLITLTLHYRTTNIIGDKELWIGPAITGLPKSVFMTLTNEVNTPSGNETTIFEGLIPEAQMAAFFPQGLNELYTYSTTYVQDGKTYSANTLLNEDGEITLKLHYKAPKK